jgi:hypothetical protein
MLIALDSGEDLEIGVDSNMFHSRAWATFAKVLFVECNSILLLEVRIFFVFVCLSAHIVFERS